MEIPIKACFISLNGRNRRDSSTFLNDQDNELDNNSSSNLDSITVNRNPSIDIEVSKKHVEYELNKNNYPQIQSNI